MKTYTRYSPDEINLIRRLRQRYKPEEIAKMVNRTEGSIHRILSLERKKGADFPKLKHGNLKYDAEKANEWRNMVRASLNYRDIQEMQGVNPATISRVLTADARGELKW